MDSQVIFEEETDPVRAPALVRKESSITKMVISFGLAKNEKDAQMVLLIIAVVSIVLAVIIVILTTHSATHTPSAVQIQQYAQEMLHPVLNSNQ